MAVVGEFCALDKKTMVEARALALVGCGMYVISSRKGDKYNCQIANSLIQVSSTPPKVLVTVNKEALTHEYIQESKVFSVSVLSSNTPKKFIMLLGFRSGRQSDKFKELSFKTGVSGTPIILEHTVAYLDCQVTNSFDCETHTLFIGKVVDAELLKTDKPMSYAYYCDELKGKTPPASPTYLCGC